MPRMKTPRKKDKFSRPESSHLEGAEAVLTPLVMAGHAVLSKMRLAKPYRPAALDQKIRSTRTRVEARLLSKAKAAGVPTPFALAVGPYDLRSSRVGGKTLNRFDLASVSAEIWNLAGRYLARLHKAGIVHGDYTPANLMYDGKKKESLVVIDFGLGSISNDTEDFAVDVLTMKKALGAKACASFLQGYKAEGDAKVLIAMKEVESRARYVDRGAG